MSGTSGALAWILAEPRALWALALALPVLAAHLVRRRRRRVVVPFVPLLVEGRGPARGASGWRRVAEASALACRLLALAALALAWARPLAAEPPPPVPLAIVVDLDVTTAAREKDGRARLAHALDLARAHVRAHADGPVSVVLAGLAPRLLARDASDREALAARLALGLEGLAPAPAEADLAAAVRFAHSLVGPGGRVTVLSARALESPPGAAPADVLGTGAADRDQGFVDVRVRPAGGPRTRVEAVLKNFAPVEATRSVRVLLGKDVLETRSVTLPPGGEGGVAVDVLPPASGAAIVLALEGSDDFAPDDRVEVWLAGPLRPTVLAVAGPGGLRPYTAALLAALGEQIDTQRSAIVQAAGLGKAGPRDVTLVDGADLPAGALVPGAWLFLAPLGGALPFAVGAPVERPLVWRTRAGHPLVRDVDLSGAWITRAWPIVPSDGVEGLAFAAADEPVLAEGEKDGVRWVALGLDPENSDLPVRAALPLLVKNALLRLARAPAAPFPPFVKAGDTLRPRAPLPGGPDARIEWPGGAATARLLSDGDGFRVPPGARGIVRVRPATAVGPEAAKAPVPSTAFVDLDRARSIVPVRPPAPPPAARPAAPEPGSPLVRLLLGIAALLLVLDLALTRTAGRSAARAPTPR